jgi:DNA-binding GntR family transcriptional regulator
MWLADPERHVPAEILAEHERILGALQDHHLDDALRLLEQHRARSETFLRVLVEPDDTARRSDRASGDGA